MVRLTAKLPKISTTNLPAMLGARLTKLAIWGLLALLLGSAPALSQATLLLDLADVRPNDAVAQWVFGASGLGVFGVPVTGGGDADGDGKADYAVAYMTASPLDRELAGEVELVFGNGDLGTSLDSSRDQPRILRFYGTAIQETTGNEIWLDDVTGDGLADLLICRQNFQGPDSRVGAGALTIVAGSRVLRNLARDLVAVDLASPPPQVALTTLVGAQVQDRLCIWTRTGDVTGDGIPDVVIGADQEDFAGEANRGAAWVLRGGSHLAGAGTIDLASFGSTALEGQIAKIQPPPGSTGHHFGGTCQVADLDANGRAEVLVAATINRAGAGLPPTNAPQPPEGAGGAPHGALYIFWDDNFPAGAWAPGATLTADALPGARTILRGGARNRNFGEEILGGLDYDDDGSADLFVGDLTGDLSSSQTRPGSGIGYVFYNARALRGRDITVDPLPPNVPLTVILGPNEGAIGGDTAAHGDFDGDGLADLAFASPHGTPEGRTNAGMVHIFYGQKGHWPAAIDTAPNRLPSFELLRMAEIQGAHGRRGQDEGDTLAYSADAADLDGDGRTDLITNEMLGNGVAPDTIDVGNLLILRGAALSASKSHWRAPDGTTPVVRAKP